MNKKNLNIFMVIFIVLLVGLVGMFYYLKMTEDIQPIEEPSKDSAEEEEMKTEEIIVDNRMLLDREKWEELSISALEIGEKFNMDPPITEVIYSNPSKGVSLRILYNPEWGTEKYKIPPYYESDKGIGFGPIQPWIGGSASRACWMGFLSMKSTEEVIAELNKKADESFPFGAQKETISEKIINNLTVIMYNHLGEMDEANYHGGIIIGEKYNYHMSDCGKVSLEEIIKNIQLIE